MVSPSKVRAEEALIRQRANDVIEFLEIITLPMSMPAIYQAAKKLLELGRTMMTDAKIVFLDEVGAGVNRSLLSRIGDMILRLNKERNYTFCMIEHDMKFIARMCNPVIVMAEGQVLAEGSAKEIQANNDVIEAYLGLDKKIHYSDTTKYGQVMSYLVSENMVAGYGGANILNSCSIQVDLGQIAVVVGPNGAGKSTAMKAIFGMLPLQSGSVKVLNERSTICLLSES